MEHLPVHARASTSEGAGGPAEVAFVVPAHDEERLLGSTLDAIHAAARAVLGQRYEIVVVDDASTDSTGEVARAHGARVVRVEHRHIAAARNAGAAATAAPILFFVDADTLVNADVVRQALHALCWGALGGGALARFDRPLGWPLRAVLAAVSVLFRALQYSGGCFLFCRRQALREAGGWDEKYFAAEEIELACALKRVGRRHCIPPRARFRVVEGCVVTSARKLRSHTGWELLAIFGRLWWRGRRGLQSRASLGFWYERRPDRD